MQNQVNIHSSPHNKPNLQH